MNHKSIKTPVLGLISYLRDLQGVLQWLITSDSDTYLLSTKIFVPYGVLWIETLIGRKVFSAVDIFPCSRSNPVIYSLKVTIDIAFTWIQT